MVAVGLAGSGCGSSAPSRPPPRHAESPAPTRAPTAPPAPTPSKPIAAANVAALTAALGAAGQTVTVQVDGQGRVRELEVRAWERSAAFVNAYPEPYVRAFVKAHGDSLGYGPLGEGSDKIAMSDDALGSPATLLVAYPKAQGCPGLAVLFRYTYGHDVRGVVGIPMGWEVLCPSEPHGMDRIQEASGRGTGDVVQSRAVTAALEGEPLVKWLVANGYGRPTLVVREPDSIRVRLPELGGPEARTPLALAREVGEGAAAASGLPKLDKVTVRYTRAVKPRPKEIGEVELAESRSSGGVCADPRVIVSLRLTSDEKRTPSVDEVKVVCARESASPGAPADSARVLPRTFATGPEYLVHCRTTSYAFGTSNTGLVVDRRGDVYSYGGGQPTEGTTVSALTAQLRHGKTFHGTLPTADVERLVELIPKIAQEKWRSTPRQSFDGPSGDCVYLRSGASKDALLKVPIHSYDNAHEASRDGEATRAAEQILGRAETLKARGL